MEMEFTYKNKEEINGLYIHDSTFMGFSYDYSQRKTTFVCDNFCHKTKFYFEFNNTLLCYFQSCSFWHGGNCILDVSVEEETPQMNELKALQEQKGALYQGSYLDKGIFYLQIKFTLNSGDTFLIVCEKVYFREETY